MKNSLFIGVVLLTALITSPLVINAQKDSSISPINKNIINPKIIDNPAITNVIGNQKFYRNEKEDWPEIKRGNNNLVPRFVPAKPSFIEVSKNHVAGLFAIKFTEGSHIRQIDGVLKIDDKNLLQNKEELSRLSRAKLDPQSAVTELGQVTEILNEAKSKAGFQVNYMFRTSQTPYKGDEQYQQKSSLENKVAEELADMDLYYIVYVKDFKDREYQQSLINKLNGFRIVELAYPLVITTGADIKNKNTQTSSSFITPDISSQQRYLDPAPLGVDARFAWTRPGGRGDNVRVTDIEYDWVTDHEDFPRNRFWGIRNPIAPYARSGSEHGTAVLGVLASPHNGFGISGIAPNIQYGISSILIPDAYIAGSIIAAFSGENFEGRCHNVAVATAIALSLPALRSGDALLIEQHAPGPSTGVSCPGCNCGQWEYVPMEYYQECFDIIRLASALGIIVIEAAGNGGQNLDNAAFGNRFNLSVRNSQALMIGASNGNGDMNMACFSNNGRRVDVHGWGGSVVTLGYGDGAGSPIPFNNSVVREFYTTGFSGTSSASPIVAGCVASIQGVRRNAGLAPITVFDVRNLLRTTGTPQGVGGNIGPLPNLRSAISSTIAMPGGFSGTGDYTIRIRSSGRVLDIDESFCFWCGPNGKKLQQWDSHGGLNQQFRITDLGGGFVRITARHSGLALDVEGSSTADNVRIFQFTPHGGLNQQWTLQPVAGGFFEIVSRNSGKVMGVEGASGSNGASIKQFTRNGTTSQQFQLTRIR